MIPHQFKPGQSGNPGGRPARRPMLEELWKSPQEKDSRSKQGQTYLQGIIDEWIRRAMASSDTLLKEILDRIDGRVGTEEQENTGHAETIVVIDIPRPDRNSKEVMPSVGPSIFPPPPKSAARKEPLRRRKHFPNLHRKLIQDRRNDWAACTTR